MALDAKEIITEITLELDREEISIDAFRIAVEEFVGLVKEVTKASFPKKDASAWLVKVYPGSAGIGVVRKPGAFNDEQVQTIRTNMNEGLVLLEKGERHQFFTDKAISHGRKLGSLFRESKIPARVRLWGEREAAPLDVTRTMAAKATYLLEAAYEDDGAVEGYLEKLNGHGQFEFVVYDLIGNRAITCEVGQDKLKDACASFLKRVEVVGRVRYRRDGMPVSVKASEIIPFPSKEEIPDLDTMRMILSGN